MPYGRQPAAVSLLQEAFSAECSSCVAAQTTLILQHKRVLGAQAQEAAQQPASQSRSTAELPPGASLPQGKLRPASLLPPAPAGQHPGAHRTIPLRPPQQKPSAKRRHRSPPAARLDSGSIPTAAATTQLDISTGTAPPTPSRRVRPPPAMVQAELVPTGMRGEATTSHRGTASPSTWPGSPHAWQVGAPEGPRLTCHRGDRGGPQGSLRFWGHSPNSPGTFGKALPGRPGSTSALALPALPNPCPSVACRPHRSPCQSTVYPQLPELTIKRDRDQGCGLQRVLARGRYEGMCFGHPRALVSVPSDALCTTFCWPLKLVTTAQQRFKMRNRRSRQAPQSSSC